VNVEPTAILVWHGMGQQIPFETIELVARSLAREEYRRTSREAAVTPRLVKFGDQKLWRAELELTGREGKRHPVHVYEAYWAPLTQGKATLADTVRSLLVAGVNGFRYALLPPCLLPRYLFDRWVDFPLRPHLAIVYAGLLLAVVALVVVNFTITATLAVKLFSVYDAIWWPSYALLSDLTVDFVWLSLTFAASGVALGLAYLSQRQNWRRGDPATRRMLPQAGIWVLLALTLVTTLVVGGLVSWHLFVHLLPNTRQWAWSPSLLVGIVVWVGVIVGSAVVRWFLLEFVGDSAIYVSSHKLNRYFETRQAIKDYSCAVATAIYRFGGYRQHILVGHSLGSVIAYDTLNHLTNDDKLRKTPLEITRRTALLLTVGSVLDKTAFLFRVQSTVSDIREVLAGAVQPLISDAAARPKWVNIFSGNDPLGGSLEYYDPENGLPRPPEPRPLPAPVSNVPDRDAWIPLIAHVQYWTNRPFVYTLVTAITG
jgi:hypothetical protein